MALGVNLENIPNRYNEQLKPRMLLFSYEKGTMNARCYLKLRKDKAPLGPYQHLPFFYSYGAGKIFCASGNSVPECQQLFEVVLLLLKVYYGMGAGGDFYIKKPHLTLL
jgi:hypothetical protein